MSLNSLSRVWLVIREFLALITKYRDISKRLQASPGIPVQNPTLSFWTVPNSPVAKHLSDLPPHADIVILGSGITGTSFARTVLGCGSNPLQVVMLDARDACSGASGRNGGHVNPPLYSDYGQLKKNYGQEMAKKLIRFRLSHLPEMKRVLEDEGILEETQCRQVEHCDVYYDQGLFDSAKKMFKAYRADMPDEAADVQVYESKECIEKFHVAADAIGCFVNHGGAINPYRLVTGVLSRLLSRYPDNFHLLTNTPCTSISPPTTAVPYYTLSTPRGTITAPHIVHATNAYASHLIPPLRSKLVPGRGTMTAQRPGLSLNKSSLAGFRSFVFYRQTVGYDYLTQLPNGENELMIGGAIGTGGIDVLFKEVANADDSGYDANIAAYLSGIIPVHFGEANWGAEKLPEPQRPDENDGVRWNEGRVKAIWSGIICLSADWLPWVGRLPMKLTGRQCPPASSTPAIGVSKPGEHSTDTISPVRSTLTSSPGEWISAGYTGEGMVHAWLCAKALAFMVLGAEEDGKLKEWFPDVMSATEARWRKANIENLLDELGDSD